MAADLLVLEPRRCLLSHYRSLDPRALAAVKALRDSYEEETLGWKPRNCSVRLRRAPPRPASCALRPVARGLADARAALSSLRRRDLLPGTRPTLELLAAAGRDVGACVSAARAPRPSAPLREAHPICERVPLSGDPGASPIHAVSLELVRPGWSRKALRPPRRRHQARRAESPQCHEATVIFNLQRLLTWDLRLVAHLGPCV
ncbi:LOW QUALITY PROTEIN: interferon lambda-4-like [Dugong dugon]